MNTCNFDKTVFESQVNIITNLSLRGIKLLHISFGGYLDDRDFVFYLDYEMFKVDPNHLKSGNIPIYKRKSKFLKPYSWFSSTNDFYLEPIFHDQSETYKQ